MAHYEIHNPNSGQSLGVYEGATERAAIEACVKDAGYDSIEDMEQRLDSKCELAATLVATDDEIERLSTEAGEHGDLEIVAICRRALDGDESARAECVRAIADARAQAD